jgi:hypothetical protein
MKEYAIFQIGKIYNNYEIGIMEYLPRKFTIGISAIHGNTITVIYVISTQFSIAGIQVIKSRII